MNYDLDGRLLPQARPEPAPTLVSPAAPAPAPLIVSPFVGGDIGPAWVSPTQVAWIMYYACTLPLPRC